MSSVVPVGHLIDGRYRIEAVIGRGGSSTVYRAFDARSEQACALKCFKGVPGKHAEQLAALFQREYATLEQLTHPSVIRVRDFGIAEEGAYYTMELLEGAELRRLAPLPWKTACRMLREVASALALLHSRRLIHRDVTPSNVYCTDEGHAKLMDFGAMTDMGVALQLVGTPPYIAPEAADGQALDGRVDVFALGALAYFALTRKHAYPASSVTDLASVWRSPTRPPSELADEVPRNLDELVMSMLSIDARARPASAAEVIERLTAIADLGRDRRLDTARAYLATPPLIGREEPLRAFRAQLGAAHTGQGSAILIAAEPGLGRTRLLDACMLEARMSGALVLRASGERALSEDLALLRLLAHVLLEATPELALRTARAHEALLGQLLPELHGLLGRPEPPSIDASQLTAHIQLAAQAWFQAIAFEQPLVIAVDDAHDADAPSLLVLTELARTSPEHALLLTLTHAVGRESPASKVLALLRASSTQLALAPLDAPATDALLRSLFGDVNNITLASAWAHEVSNGSPQALMDLAQHLVDSGHARYENGSWSLAIDPAQDALPRSLTDAYGARIARLQPTARTLAEALSLVALYAPLDLAAYPELMPHASPLRVYTALDELVAGNLLVASGAGHVFAHRALAAAVAAGVSVERAALLRRALAAIERRRGSYLAAVHYYQAASDDDAALALLFDFVAMSGETQNDNRWFWLTQTGAAVIERAIAAAESRALPPRQIFRLRKLLMQASAYVEVSLDATSELLIERLRIDAGLDFYDEGDPDSSQFVERCFPRAQQRFDACAESERGLPPLDAIRELAHAVVTLTAVYGRRIDAKGTQRLLGLVSPLRGLAPVIDLLHDITAAAVDRVRGRRFMGRIDSVLERLESSVPGLDELTRVGARRVLTYYLALEHAQLCSPKVLAYADYIAFDPLHEPLAWHLRMVHHLYAGEVVQARACRERTELLALQKPEGYSQLATSILYETEVHFLCGDLMALKAAIPAFERHAALGSGWRTFLRTVRGEYELLRGRHEVACEHFVHVLDEAKAGEHTAWSRTMTSYIEALLRMGQLDRAVELAAQACEKSAELHLNPLYPVMMRAHMAQALGIRGDKAQAEAEINAALEEASGLGMSGVPLGCLYEAAARIATSGGDRVGFEVNAEHARRQYTRGGNPRLMGKYQRLTADARRAFT